MLGGVSTYYEMLMKSRKETTSFTETDVDYIADKLQDIYLYARYVNNNDLELSNAPALPDDQIPLDPKLQPLEFVLEFGMNDSLYALFCTQDKAIQNDKYHSLLNITTKNDVPSSHDLKELDKSKSLPIWEELVHRAKPINDEVKKRAPKNPWSLFKAAKSKVLDLEDYKIQLGGYPQWLINDVDFRKIKKLEFLCELKLSMNCSVYYFNDPDLNEIVFFKQRL